MYAILPLPVAVLPRRRRGEIAAPDKPLEAPRKVRLKEVTMRKVIVAIALIGMAILFGAAPTPGLAGEAAL